MSQPQRAKSGKNKPKAKPRPKATGQNKLKKKTNFKIRRTGQKMVRMASATAREDKRELSALAKVVVSPQLMPPMRFPTADDRPLTDVKRLYVIGEYDASIFTSIVTGDNSPLVADQQLNADEMYMILLRTPVAPLIKVVPGNTNDITKHCYYSWILDGNVIGATAPGSSAAGGGLAYLMIPISTSAPINTTIDVPFEPTSSTIGPIYTVYDDGANGGGTNSINYFQDTFQPSYQTKIGTFYHFYRGGKMGLSILHAAGGGAGVALVANAKIVVTFELMQLLNPSTGHERQVGIMSITQDTGNTAVGSYWADGKGQKTNIGYYRWRVLSVQAKTGATAQDWSNVRLQAWTEYGGMPTATTAYAATQGPSTQYTPQYNTYYFDQPINVSLMSSTYLLDSARVNAMSLLVTNTSPDIWAGGSVTATEVPRDSQWWEYSPDEMKQRSANRLTGYRGNLKKGVYSWMSMEADKSFYRMSASTGTSSTVLTTQIPNMTGAYVPVVRLDRVGRPHLLNMQAPSRNLSGYGLCLLIHRVDYQMEFISDNQLANLAVCRLMPDTLTEAAIALANAPLFTENPEHLSLLWEIIKRAARMGLQGFYGNLGSDLQKLRLV